MKKRRFLKIALISGAIALPLWAVISSDAVSSKSAQVLNDLKGFYVGLGLGNAWLKGQDTINDETGDDVSTVKSRLSKTSPAVNFSLGYEKTFNDVYVLGVEANYLYTKFSTSKNNLFEDGTGIGTYPIKNTLKMNNSYGLSLSFGRRFDRITPYAKLGIVSTEFTTQAQSPGEDPNPLSAFNGSQTKRVFGLATGVGMKYALTHRLDLVTEGVAHFYQSFKTNNFSNSSTDPHTMTVDPWLFMFLVGLNWKF